MDRSFPKIIAIIPARSGSKSLPDKNIRPYDNIPLIAHSILVASLSTFISEVYVSTDSEKYKIIAENYGAIVPFLRPPEISQDKSSDLEVFKHFLNWYKENNSDYKEKNLIFVHLRPTYPNRTVELVDETIQCFLNHIENYDSLRTVIPCKTPIKCYYIEKKDNKDTLVPYFSNYNDIEEPYNQARQLFPDSFIHNGCIDIIKSEIIESSSMSGKKILPFVMKEEDDNDIDTLDDFKKSEQKY